MAGPGDRAVAGLLSALAEAPDFAAAASFFLTQLIEITKASKACMLRLDASQEHIELVAVARVRDGRAADRDSDQRSVEPARRLRAHARAGQRRKPARRCETSSSVESWVALPMSQPRFRGAPEMMAFQRGAELIGSPTITLLETPDTPTRRGTGRRGARRGSDRRRDARRSRSSS